MTNIRTGLINLVKNPPKELTRARLGLLANQASVGPDYQHAAQLIDHALPGALIKLFGPQHGFVGEKQDNMIESDHGVEPKAGRPIYSLYGETRRPGPEMLSGLDVLLVDLVDVGTRVYTFAQTMAYCLEEAARASIKVIVLDRPNPIGGLEVEGNILKPDCASFVGMFPIPMRHGFTLGELALFMADRIPEKPDLEVIEITGWHRDMYFGGTNLPWVMPSPNMPTPETAWIYPGQVMIEGTTLSEGRGTTRPFHLCGAPFIDAIALKEELDRKDLPGVVFRSASFEPTFHKFQGQLCQGVEIHPRDPRLFKPYLTSLTIMEVLMAMYPGKEWFRPPPYEYEYERLPMDLILGDRAVREGLEAGKSARELEAGWQEELAAFLKEREKYRLY
jgi:uncharacterized protein YbbC (DUF1343 family)